MVLYNTGADRSVRSELKFHSWDLKYRSSKFWIGSLVIFVSVINIRWKFSVQLYIIFPQHAVWIWISFLINVIYVRKWTSARVLIERYVKHRPQLTIIIDEESITQMSFRRRIWIVQHSPQFLCPATIQWGIFIRTPLSEQNTTLSRTPPKFSRTPLWAEHHFEQNTTQNSIFQKWKCKIYPITTLTWFTIVLLWFVNRTIYCTKRKETNRSIQLPTIASTSHPCNNEMLVFRDQPCSQHKVTGCSLNHSVCTHSSVCRLVCR